MKLLDAIKKWVRGETYEQAVANIEEPILFDPTNACPQDGRKGFQLLVQWTYRNQRERDIFVRQATAWSKRNGYEIEFLSHNYGFDFQIWKTGEVIHIQNSLIQYIVVNFYKP